MGATLDARLRLNAADFHGVLKDASRRAKATAKEMEGSFSSLRSVFAGGLGAAFGTGAIKSIFEARIEVEKLQAAMTASMGSAALGKETLGEVKKLAGDIGLEVGAAAKAFIQFQSSGMKTAEAFDVIRSGYNAILSSGGGAAEFSRFAVAIQQLRTSPKPLQEELNQLREALPTTAKLMREAFGVQRAEDLQKLGITGKEFVDVLAQMMGRLPQIGNTMGKEVARLSTVWTDFQASLADSLLGDAFQFALTGAQKLIQAGKDVKEGMQIGIESLLGLDGYNETARQKEMADMARARLEQEEPIDRRLSAEQIEEWKKENEKWRAERKKQKEKDVEDAKEIAERMQQWEIEYQQQKAETFSRELERIITETESELEKMAQEAQAIADARQTAFEGVAEARDMVQGQLSQKINENIQNRLKTPGERRAERDEQRRFERAKNVEATKLAREMLKEEREKAKKDEFDNIKKGKFWDEQEARKRLKKDAQDAVKKATEDGAMTLKDILTVLKTLATA